MIESPWDVWLCVALCAGCVCDLTEHRLPNWLTALIALGALCRSGFTGGLSACGAAIVSGIAGSGVLLAAWLRGWLGGGDVKYFFALCCYLPVVGAIDALGVASAFGGIVFGVQLCLFWRPSYNGASTRRPRLPYALALSGGFIWVVWVGGFSHKAC